MVDVVLDFPIRAPRERVFRAVSAPSEISEWWTERSAGEASAGAEYRLEFGVGFDWRARVTRCAPGAEFELELTEASEDWLGTRVGFRLEPRDGGTWVSFRHSGWPMANEHYRVSCMCWAMYLRVLRRWVEYGERVPYEARLEV